MSDAREGASNNSVLRTLGTVGATLLTSAFIIGTGIFGAVGATAEKASSGILIAMIPGGLIAFLTGLSAMQLGSAYPRGGGAFLWARKAGYETLGFIGGCCYLGQGVVGASVVALAFATYTVQALPSVPLHAVAAAAALIAIALNSYGLRFSSKIMIGLMLVIVAMLGVFVALSLHAVTLGHFSPVLGTGPLELAAGAAIFFWAWDGFMRTAIMAGEIKEPRKTLPIAIVGGIALAAVVFYAVAATALGVLGAQAMAKDDAPLFRAAIQAIGPWGGWLIIASAWMAATSEVIGDLMSVSRVGLAMGEERELPSWFGVVDPRHRVPRHAVLVVGALIFVVVLFFDLRALLPLASLYLLIWFSITHLSALKLPKDKRFLSPAWSWLGLAFCLALITVIPTLVLAVGIVPLGAALGIRSIVRRRRPRQKPDRSPEA